MSSKPESPLQHLSRLFDRSPGSGRSGASPKGQALNNETTRARTDEKIAIKDTRGREKDVWQKYSGLQGKDGSLKSNAKKIDEPLRNALWELDTAGKLDGKVDRYLDSNRNETLNSQLHIHEILHADGTVTMHITDRRDGGAAKQVAAELFLRPVSGNEVNAAEVRLAAIMRKMEQ